jgi:uncharacterized protein (TIGR03067 family)
MRRFLPLVAVLVAVAVTQGDKPVRARAPVPNAPVPPSIDGKYTLLTTSAGPLGGPAGFPGKGPGKGADPADGPAGWTTSRTTVRSETIITKNEITIEPRTATGLPTLMEYTLDPTKTPMTIDVEIINVRGKKTKALGIVEISNSRMTMALAREGTERPKTTDEAEGVTVYYFLKAPPPPKVEYRIVAMRVGGEEEAEKELNKLTKEGFELVNTTSPIANNDKASVTTVHFILKRTVK